MLFIANPDVVIVKKIKSLCHTVTKEYYGMLFLIAKNQLVILHQTVSS